MGVFAIVRPSRYLYRLRFGSTCFAVLIIFAFSFSYPNKSNASNSLKQSGLPDGCFQLAANETNKKVLAPQATNRKQKKTNALTKEMVRPVTKKEMPLFIKALTPVLSKDKKSWGLGFITDKSGIPIERLGMFIGDATSLLITVHTRNALGRMKKAAKPDKKSIQWMETALAKVELCAQGRFKGRGGLTAYQESLQLAQQFETQLAPIIINQLRHSVTPVPIMTKSKK